MSATTNFSLANAFSNPEYISLCKWIEQRVREGLSDEQIIDKFKIREPNWQEEDVELVKWFLYYYQLVDYRGNVPREQEDEKATQPMFEDDFDRLLDDFIANHLSDDDDDDDEEEGENAEIHRQMYNQLKSMLESPEQSPSESLRGRRREPDIVCHSVSVRVDESQTSRKGGVWSNNTNYEGFFKREHYLHFKLSYSVSPTNHSDLEVVLQNDRCHTSIKITIYASQLREHGDSIIFSIDGEELIPRSIVGEDSIDIIVRNSDTSELLYSGSKKLICANSLFNTLRIDRMAFFPAQRGSNALNCNLATGYVSFELNERLQVNVHSNLSSTVGVMIECYNLRYNLYDQTGMLVEKHTAEIYEDSSTKTYVAYCGFNGDGGFEWSQGRYKVELTALGRTVVLASFKVGSPSLEGEIDVVQAVSMLRANSMIDYSSEEAMGRLEQMVGLKSVKEKILSLSRLSMLAQKRKQMGLPVKGTSLHARFVGNPGTGKTTIAEIMGQIYKDLGLLSRGHVVRAERRTLVGRYYDSELRATEQAIESAQGGVLFIDEAYNLYTPDDPRDPGKRVLEALLTALSDEQRRDWMLVLAGYPDEIEQMMNANPGIKSRVNETFFFDDYSVEELMKIADLYCKRNKYKMSAEVRGHLESVVMRDYGARDKNFGNARYINNLMEQSITANMAHRLCRIEKPTMEQLQRIEVEDIPSLRSEEAASRGLDGLNQMVGLSSLKRSISQHLNMVKLANLRIKQGLHTQMPPLHMVFTGNPGTGKTTVADFMGEIYASMGLLTKGDVISVEKRDLVGSHVGETESKMKSILNRAKGNILFIDEAYQLCAKDGQNDYGESVINSLLTTLSNDKVDMIVILAGYPKDMERLLNMNEGLRSRFPYTFHFEDYSVEELHKIALQRAKAENYAFSPKAERLLYLLIKREVLRKRSSFGNARFVTRLISSEILPRMATRLSAQVEEPTKRQLKTIIADDIPITAEEAKAVERGGFDDSAIDAALLRLDALVGQSKVKRAIHNFVDIARYLNSQGEKFVGKGVLKWSFVGNTGTGKSVVAEILADILKAMNLLDKGNIVEVRGEQIFNVSEYQCDQVLRQAMERSRHGLLFIDGDAPEFRNMNEYRMTSEHLRIKLTSLVAEMGGQGALVIAECNSPRQTIANSLTINGIYDFDHTFFFDDYSSEELFEILSMRLAKHKISFSPEAESKIRKYIDSLCEHRNLSFANARTMKHLARTIYEQVILRASRDKGSGRGRVLLEDVESYNWQQPRKLGY